MECFVSVSIRRYATSGVLCELGHKVVCDQWRCFAGLSIRWYAASGVLCELEHKVVCDQWSAL